MGPIKFSQSIPGINLVTKPTLHLPTGLLQWPLPAQPGFTPHIHTLPLTSRPHPCLWFLLNPQLEEWVFKCKSNHIILLFKTLQWFTISLSIKSNFFSMACKNLWNLQSRYFSTFIFHHLPLVSTFLPHWVLHCSLSLSSLWANYLSSQCLSFLIYKMGIKIRTSENFC